MKVTCPYCNQAANSVFGDHIYPHRKDLYSKRFFCCDGCDAYVGCHPDGAPLGRLADKALRAAKMRAHAAFDPSWKSGHMSRAQAYAWLAGQLGLDKKSCHIGMFDVEMCNRVVAVCQPVEAA